MIEIKDEKGRLCGLVIKNVRGDKGDNKDQSTLTFFTPTDLDIQVGYLHKVSYDCVYPHIHLPVLRSITTTSEVLYVIEGGAIVTFFCDGYEYQREEVNKGEIVIILRGGHSLLAREGGLQAIYIKQGPYQDDKNQIGASKRVKESKDGSIQEARTDNIRDIPGTKRS